VKVSRAAVRGAVLAFAATAQAAPIASAQTVPVDGEGLIAALERAGGAV
jgi:hypothetical protein